MGLEYTHYLFVDDLSFIGTLETAVALEEVLRRWGLVSGTPTISSLDGGKARRLRQSSLDNVSPDTSNILVEYPYTEADTIESVMGPSWYDDVDSRYIQRLVLLIGSDYRVYSGYETAFTNVKTPPMNNGEEIEPFETNYDIHYYADAYPADSETEPPVAVLEPDRQDWPLPKGFEGIWRCGVILDCGKDLPGFMEKTNKLPSTQFASDITNAFGRRVVQVGHFC